MTETLRRALVAAGRLDDDGFARRTRPCHCPGCGMYVLRGLDAERMGLPVTTDVLAVSSAGEIAAIFDGIPTYELHPAGDRIEVDYRDRYRIRSRPADAEGVHVVTAHECGKSSPFLKPVDRVKVKGKDDDIPPY